MMGYQTMNIHSVESITVAAQVKETRPDGSSYYVQQFTFSTACGSTMQVTAFSDTPGVLRLASELAAQEVA